MNPLLTDEAVAALPLDGARAALLEEIVGTPTGVEEPVPDGPPRRGHRWAAPLAAAAAIAALLTGPTWWPGNAPDDTDRPSVAGTSPAVVGPSSSSYRAVLDARGWTAVSTYEDPTYDTGEVGYRNGGATVSIDWYPASGYAERLDSRRRLTDPPSDGRPVEVVGLPARLWSSSPTAHVVLRPVQAGHFLEIRGSGIGTRTFLGVLTRLRLVDAAGLEASLPPGFVGSDERDSRVAARLDGIARYAHPLLPVGVQRGSITSQQSDPVQVDSEVAERVTCAWLSAYAEARRTGDAAGAEQAVTVMRTSRQWPVLRRIRAASDVPEWVWAVTDEMAAGQVPQGWRPSCQGYLP